MVYYYFPIMRVYNLLYNQQPQAVPQVDGICVTGHIMWSTVQMVYLFAGSSHAVVFNADITSSIILFNRRINYTPIFIMIYAVLDKICDCTFQQVLICVNVTGFDGFWEFTEIPLRTRWSLWGWLNLAVAL